MVKKYIKFKVKENWKIKILIKFLKIGNYYILKNGKMLIQNLENLMKMKILVILD